MLKVINTKLLAAIVALLAVMAGISIYRNHEAEQKKREDAAFWRRVEEEKKREKTDFKRDSDAWRNYIP